MKRQYPLVFFAATAVAVYFGVDFSPGFSEGLIGAFLLLYAAGLCVSIRWKACGDAFGCVGAICVFPAVYVYAAGDDWAELTVWVTLLISAAVYIVLRVMTRKQKMRFSERLLRALLITAGVYTLLSGVPSTALLPAGIGLLLLFAARYIEKCGTLLTAAGLLSVSAFLLAPMLFAGGAL